MTKLAGTVSFLVLSLFAAAAAAQPRLDLADEAELQFELGVEAYRRGNYQGALEHYLASNRLVPNKNVVFNIARAYEQLQRFDAAFRYYSDFLAQELEPADRRGAEEAIARIRPRVALLRVETTPPGATVYIDRRDLGPRGVTPRSLALAPGRYRVIAELEGYEPGQGEPAEVAVGRETVVQLELRRVLGAVRVTGSPAGAEIRVDEDDGPIAGRLPGTIETVPGQHTLVISAPGHQTVRREVTVEARRTARLAITLPLETGTVVVSAEERDALIEIDGRAVGFTPAVLPAVPAGRHRVRVSLAGFRTYEEWIEVEPRGRTNVDVRLRSREEVTAASRATESIEDAPASVTLVPQEELRAFGYHTLYDALGGVRGIFQSDDRTYQSLGFRGFSRPGDYGNRILVLMDGHTMNDDQLGSSYVGYDFRSDLDDVERVEVVRGPGSVLYGTNAFFGVINVVTRDAETMLRPHVSIGAEGFRTARARAGGGVRVSRDAGAWVSVAGVESQGEDIRFEDLGGAVARDADTARAATLTARGWLGDFTLELAYHTRRKRIPTGAFFTIFADPRAHSDDSRGFAELRWEPAYGNVQVYSRAFVDHYEFDGAYPYAAEPPDPAGVQHDTWNGWWAGAEARAVLAATDWLSITAGTEIRRHFAAELRGVFVEDAGGSEPTLEVDPRFTVFGAYGVVDVEPMDHMRVSVGTRLDWFSTFGTSINPRAAVIWQPVRGSIFKGIAGTAFRAPSPYELFYEDGCFTQTAPGEGGLDPERVYTGEIEYTQRVGQNVSVVGAAFYNEITGRIEASEVMAACNPSDPVLRYDNVDDTTRTVGGELEVRHDWRRGFMASAAYSFQRTRLGSLADDGEARLDNSPEHMLTLKGAAPLAPEAVSLASRLRVEAPRRTVALEEGDWVVLWDVAVTGEVARGRLRYEVGVRNLFDWTYGLPGGADLDPIVLVPQPRRTFFASATLFF